MGNGVSILVLMEVLREANVRLARCRWDESVSILVLMEVLREEEGIKENEALDTMFQSLF